MVRSFDSFFPSVLTCRIYAQVNFQLKRRITTTELLCMDYFHTTVQYNLQLNFSSIAKQSYCRLNYISGVKWHCTQSTGHTIVLHCLRWEVPERVEVVRELAGPSDGVDIKTLLTVECWVRRLILKKLLINHPQAKPGILENMRIGKGDVVS